MQNNPNYLVFVNEIQSLLNQLNNHLFKINEIIVEMNNIINNQMNNAMMVPMNNLMNQMNNFMNFGQFNPNFIFNKENLENFKSQDIVNVTFEKDKIRMNIKVERNSTIKNLLKLYFIKINRPDLIDNYKGKMTFLYNARKIDEFNTIGELIGPISVNPIIIVVEHYSSSNI